MSSETNSSHESNFHCLTNHLIWNLISGRGPHQEHRVKATGKNKVKTENCDNALVS